MAALNSGELLCGECGAQASDFCCCDYPVGLVCRGCVKTHRDKAVDEMHIFFPTTDLWKVERQTDAVRAQCKGTQLKVAESLVRKNLSAIEKCQSDLNTAFELAFACLQQARTVRMQALEDLKTQLVTTIESSLDEVKVNLLNKSYSPSSEISRVINEFNASSDLNCLSLFRYWADETKIASFSWEEGLGITWTAGLCRSGYCSHCGKEAGIGGVEEGSGACVACRGKVG